MGKIVIINTDPESSIRITQGWEGLPKEDFSVHLAPGEKVSTFVNGEMRIVVEALPSNVQAFPFRKTIG